MAKHHEAENGHEEEVASYEQELAGYLQERIKPGLNRGAIPLLARSIAKEIAHREHPNGASEDAEVEDEHSAELEDEDTAEADDEATAEANDEDSAGADDEDSAEADDEDSAESEAPPDFEADMHELQAELGEDWILRFSVQGDDAWLTAEKDDGSQRVEAPTASVLHEAVELLNEGGGRST
jgi:nucleoid-associated protein YgaU